MKEILDHNAYQLLKNEYKGIDVDYVILSTDMDYEGVETHKKAVIEAFQILNTRNADRSIYIPGIKVETEKMQAQMSSMDELLQLPDDKYYDTRPKKTSRRFSIPRPTRYWFAFLQPPYGVPYLKSDFIFFNTILFPNKEHCEVYRWNDEFSNYFDAGKEWWGTGLWTVYDKITGIVVVIGASLTD